VQDDPSSVSLITRGQFTMNSLHKDKWWIKSVIWKCWQGYGNLLEGNDLNSGLTSGLSTMTMPLRMMC
jgi:hypothetical protein